MLMTSAGHCKLQFVIHFFSLRTSKSASRTGQESNRKIEEPQLSALLIVAVNWFTFFDRSWPHGYHTDPESHTAYSSSLGITFIVIHRYIFNFEFFYSLASTHWLLLIGFYSSASTRRLLPSIFSIRRLPCLRPQCRLHTARLGPKWPHIFLIVRQECVRVCFTSQIRPIKQGALWRRAEAIY